MTDIISLLACLGQIIDTTTLCRLSCIVEGLLSMTGRVTMLGISRWTHKGGSYRTIQRFFNTTISWCQINWFFIRHCLLDKDDVILLAGDESTITKAGKQTYGIDRFFSSMVGKPVRGIAFFCLSLISVKHRKSYPVKMEQVIKPKQEEKRNNTQAPKKDRKRGRPKGSKNKNRKDVDLSPYLLWIKGLLNHLLKIVGTDIPIMYFLHDAALGNNSGLQMVLQCGLHLISKLRYDSALWFPYQGHYKGRGKRKKYGEKLNYQDIPKKYLKESSVEEGIKTDTYQMSLWHKLFADMLNVVVIVRTNLETGATARVVLFSSDMNLSWDKIIDYYGLRFQIEFNFRDAKQYWGLEDFMNVKSTPVYNGANLAMFMVNVSLALISRIQEVVSVNDLKAWFRGHKYVQETLKLLQEIPEPIFIEQIYASIAALGKINVQPKPA
jgi:hypothetical protein